MSTPILWVTRLYASLLYLYPPAFRQELGAEMQTVFNQVAGDAERSGWLSLLFVCWRELRDLPVNLAEAHRNHPQGGYVMKTPDYSRWFGDPQSPPDEVEPRPWREISLGASFFVLFILLIISNIWSRYDYLPSINQQAFGTTILIVSLVLLLGFLFLGVVRKFPDWSLPYVGFAVSMLSAMALLAINNSQPTLLIAILFFLSPVIAILISRWIKPLRPLWQKIWLDPTRLGLVTMGLMVFAFMLILDDTPYEEFVVSGCIVLVIPFAVLYLRSHRLWQRVFIPPIGFLVAWIYCIYFTGLSYDFFDQSFAFRWNAGGNVMTRIGLLILVWFLLPGLWILLRRVNWISPVEV